MHTTASAESVVSQLGFDFTLGNASAVGINRFGVTSLSDLELADNSGCAAGDALSRMIVDDRVLRMGMTNWRALLDRAISLGHTELYASEDGQQGLRTPGYRFGPINRLPSLGPEYVENLLFRRALQVAFAAGTPVKSRRIVVDETSKLGLSIHGESARVDLYRGRKAIASFELSQELLPSLTSSAPGQRAASHEIVRAAVERAVSGIDSSPIIHSLEIAFKDLLTSLRGKGVR